MMNIMENLNEIKEMKVINEIKEKMNISFTTQLFNGVKL